MLSYQARCFVIQSVCVCVFNACHVFIRTQLFFQYILFTTNAPYMMMPLSATAAYQYAVDSYKYKRIPNKCNFQS